MAEKKKRTPAQIGKASRVKGKAFEQEVARRFREVMPTEKIVRGWQAHSGANAADVVTPVFWVECKRSNTATPEKALTQAQADAPDGRVPLAILKKDRKVAYAAMTLDDFMELVREWWELKNL